MPDDLLLKDFKPTPQLITKTTLVEKPRFPVIDAHNHLTFAHWDYDQRPVSQLIDTLDEAHIRVYVDLDGGCILTISKQQHQNASAFMGVSIGMRG